MSYILDALQKSQRDREIGNVPTLSSEPLAETGTPERRFSAIILVSIAIALIAVAIAIYATLSRAVPVVADKPTVATEPDPVPAPLSPPVKKPVAALAKTEKIAPQKIEVKPVAATKPIQKTKAVQAALPEKNMPDLREDLAAYRQEMLDLVEAEKVRENSRKMPKPDLKPEPAEKEALLPATDIVATKPPIDAKTVKSRKYKLQKQLPATIAASIPEQRVLVHVWSKDPTQRFVILNSRRVQEGDRTSDGLELIEIQKTGLVLKYQGHTFFSPK